MAKENQRRPKEGWRQLDFRTIICLPNAFCAAVFFFFLFIASLILCSVILSFSAQIKSEESSRFNLEDDISNISINISSTMEKPVFVYLVYYDYHQNHRIYLKSKSKSQLAGKSDNSLSTNCKPLLKFDSIDDVDFGQGNTISSEKIVPCGLLPASFFNITIDAKRNSSESNNITIDDSDIAWGTDDENKYKDDDNAYLKITDSHFKVWMRTSATNKLRKLYGKINEKLEEDDVILFDLKLISENHLKYYPDMKIILSTTTTIGGRNFVLGWVFFVVMVLSLIWTITFTVIWRKQSKEDLLRN
ncbi:hypothetical protein SteCoe_10846 [Stentor coeruleus]|uniref:Uncharacterized protein n=1 Tax=Stentor coeruleus TaxID=5963 RepID=A0A1R2CEI6_9CILI|nr:hypothetical protein SteCoe_10846 [Stentor coeruleus]